MTIAVILDGIRQEIRYTIRVLWRSPIFAIGGASSLALAIGATTAAFEVLNTAVLHDAPWPTADRVLALGRAPVGKPPTDWTWSLARYADIKEVSSTIAVDAAAFADLPFAVGIEASGRVARVGGEIVSPSYLRTVGIAPASGRWFEGTSIGSQEHAVAVASARFVQEQLGGIDPLGASISVNGTSATIVGVLPPDFHGVSGTADLWLPAADAPRLLGDPTVLGQFYWGYRVILRTHQATNVDLRAEYAQQLARGMNVGAINGPVRELHLERADARLIEPGVRSVFTIVLAAALCVLVLVSANLGGLFVARTEGRRALFAVRAALGAGRSRLVRTIVFECAAVGSLGGLLGVAIADPLAGIFWRLRPVALEKFAVGMVAVAPTVNKDVILVAAAAVLLSVLLMAALSWAALRRSFDGLTQVHSSLAGMRAHLPGAAHIRRMAAVAQIGIAFALGIATIILAVTLHRVSTDRYGITTANTLTARLDLPKAMYDARRARLLIAEMRSALLELPAVTAVGMDNAIALGGDERRTASIVDLALPMGEGGRGTTIRFHAVTPGYFAVIGARLLAGRDFRDDTDLTEPLPMIVNRAAADRFWPGRSSVGSPFESVSLTGLRAESVRGQVVGVVENIQYERPGQLPEPSVFVAATAAPPQTFAVVIRTASNPAGVIDAVRRVVRQLDPSLVVYDARTMEDRLRAVTSATRFSSTIVTGYALIALCIAMIGVYAIMTTGASERLREMAIRIALGASRRVILSCLLREAGVVISCGIILGVGGSYFAVRFLSHQVFGISQPAAWWYLSAALLFFVAGIVPCLHPAMRAARVDPAIILRSE